AGLAPAPQRLLPVLGGKRPIPSQLFLGRISWQFHRMAELAGSQDQSEGCSGRSHTHSAGFVPDPRLTLRPKAACRSPWYPGLMAQEIGQFHQLAGILTQIIQGKSVSQEVRSHVQARDLGSTRQALEKRLDGTRGKG